MKAVPVGPMVNNVDSWFPSVLGNTHCWPQKQVLNFKTLPEHYALKKIAGMCGEPNFHYFLFEPFSDTNTRCLREDGVRHHLPNLFLLLFLESFYLFISKVELQKKRKRHTTHPASDSLPKWTQ